MAQLLQALLSGLATGSIYALIALGLVLLYRSTRVLNFAHGEFGLLGAFLAFLLVRGLWQGQGLSYPASFVASLAAAALLGGLVSLVLVKPPRPALALGLGLLLGALAYGLGLGLGSAALVGAVLGAVAYVRLEPANRRPGELGMIILTLGVGLFLQGFYALAFGTDNKVLPTGLSEVPLRVAGASVSRLSLLTSLVAVSIMLLLWLLLSRSKLGLAMRAVAQREEVARSLGLPVRLVTFTTWGVSAALAAAAALLLAPSTLLSPAMMLEPLSKGFVAAVIGGMTSLPGAILGGFLLGVLELLVGVYLSNDFKASFAFLAVLLMLVLRPHGLLGKPEVRRV